MDLRMLRPAAALATLVLAVVLPSAPAAAATGPRSSYAGTATVTLTTYEYCGPNFSRVPSGRQVYSAPARLLVGKRRSVGKVVEPNPFSFVLATRDQASAGAVSLWSSAVSTVSNRDLGGHYRDPRLLVAYWKTSYRSGTLSGRMIATHAAEGLALNLYVEPRPLIPCRTGFGALALPAPVRVGTTLNGTLTAKKADLTVAGGTTTGLAEFVLRFRA